MAYGTANVDNIQSSTANTPVVFKDGNGTQIGTLCRAWAKFAGASGTVSASFNVSSVTRNSTGSYTVTFTNALADTNYSTSWAVSANAGNAFGGYESSSTARTTTTVTLLSINTALGTAGDCAIGSVAIFR